MQTFNPIQQEALKIMLKGRLLQPQIIKTLAAAGHGSTVLIADGNYPASTKVGRNGDVVYMNLCPGKVLVTDVLETLLSTIPVEAAQVMQPEDGSEPEIYPEFRNLLPDGVDLQPLGRFEFYHSASGPDHALTIATGDQRLYANILLTIGVVAP